MLSLIFRFTGKYKKETIITPILTVIECIFDVLIPYVSTLAMICGAVAGRTSAIASTGFVKNLRLAMFDKISSYSFRNIEKFEVPSLVTRITKDMRELRMAYVALVRQFFRAPFQLLFCAIMIYNINHRLSLVFWIAIPFLALGLFLIMNIAHPRFRVLMSKFDDMNAKLEENFIAVRVVKTFVRENYEKLKFKATSENVRDFQRRAENIVLLDMPFFNLVTYSCMIAIC